MGKRKFGVEDEGELKVKRLKSGGVDKIAKPNLLDQSDSSASEADFTGDTNLSGQAFKINEEYARRFEHNKKREELHKCRFFLKAWLMLY